MRNKRPSRTQYVIGLSPAPPRFNVDVSARPTAISISGRLFRTPRTLDAIPTFNLGGAGVCSRFSLVDNSMGVYFARPGSTSISTRY